ncbi:MAG: zinc-binding alcohol dehydrogenase family protein, partial [Verrucomicrobiaceae bacterium]
IEGAGNSSAFCFAKSTAAFTLIDSPASFMRALSLAAPHQFEFVEIPEAASPGPDEALVRIHAVGVCGTDVSGYLGKMPFIQYPRILGHELGVEVLAVGDQVKNVKAGDRCSVEPYLNCGVCAPCLRGLTNCCEKLEVLGVHTDGGLRPRLLLSAHKLHRAENLSFEQLALVETLAIGCHAVNRAEVNREHSVMVIGAGPIGLSVIEFVRLTGARLHVIETDERRRQFVRSNYGIEVEAEPGGMADIVFDATGHPASMSKCFAYAAFAGRVVFVGITPEPVPLNDPLFHRRELTLLASRNAVADDFTRIIGLIRDGSINTAPWITHRMAFGEVPVAFPKLLQPGSGVVKAVITMD